MSTFIAARAALLTLCRAYSGGTVFTEANSAFNDRTVLDAAETHALEIERTAPTVRGRRVDDIGGHGYMVERHTLTAYVCTAHGTGDGGYGSTVEESEQFVEDLAAYLAQYERLGGVAARALVTEIGVPGDNAARTHVLQGITVTAWCKSSALPLEVGE